MENRGRARGGREEEKISFASPLARALIGKKKGAEVEAQRRGREGLQSPHSRMDVVPSPLASGTLSPRWLVAATIVKTRG